jgi:phosphatidylserine/phosphatidylglycerophosphate/cardiolipin synthase-like enzyme
MLLFEKREISENATTLSGEVKKPARDRARSVVEALKKRAHLTFEQFQERVKVEPWTHFERKLEERTGSICTLNEMELLTVGPEAFAEIERQIEMAESSISVNIFSWASDSAGLRLAEKIAEVKKKKPELKITVQVDKMGTFFNGTREGIRQNIFRFINEHTISYFLKYRHIRTKKLLSFAHNANAAYHLTDIERQELESFVGEVLTHENLIKMNPAIKILSDVLGDDLKIVHNGLAGMDHSKVYIFDETLVLSGGMNIGDEYSGGWNQESGWAGQVKPDYWKDYMLKAKGPVSDIAKQMLFSEQNFSDDRVLPSKDAQPVRLLRNSRGPLGNNVPFEQKSKMKQITYSMYALIDNAEKDLVIEHAYIMDQTVIGKLQAAALRGVMITIVRGRPETASLARANEEYFSQLYNRQNIKIINDNRVLHSKLICADSKFTIIGSANLSQTSLYDHEEVSFLLSGDTPLQAQINERIREMIG